jgi:CRP-like cAMP-binding protein
MNPYLLSDNYLLREATLGDIDSIHAICETRDFAAGDAVVSAQTKDQDIMVVLEGRVRVETLQGDLIGELRTGAMIGEIAFLDGKGRTANVFSVGATKVVVIPADRLRELMKQSPRLESVILRNAALALCQRLREANQQIESLMNPR